MSIAVALSHKNPVYAADTVRFAESLLLKARKMESVLKPAYIAKINEHGRDVEANKMLRKSVDRISRADLNLAAYDDELQRFCNTKALQCERLMYRKGVEAVRDLMSVYGLKIPLNKEKKECTKRPACKKWWLRQVRTMANRECEQICRELAAVSKKKSPYISEFSLSRWVESQRRNISLLESLEAENDQGQVFGLSELAELGASNPAIRRGELMVRMRGFEEWAESDSKNWASLFITVTCPSKYHAVHSYGGINKRYQGATPRQAQQYLTKIWAQIRAELARDEVEYFGFRIAEPHHDGTPHWHMVLFVLDDQKELLSDTIQDYAMRMDGWEPGADEHRYTCVEIDPEKGTAAGYIAKYVSKNIDGFMVGVDLEADSSALETSARVRAWASIWGIRQFQQIGGPGVTVYRELRRLANHQEQMPLLDRPEENDFEEVLQAADRGNWAEYTEKMGGAVCRRDARPIQTWRRVKDELGRYGEALEELKGLWSWWFAFPLKTRVFNWKVRFKESIDGLADQLRSPPGQALDLCQ